MTPHTCKEFDPDCYRCDLARDEAQRDPCGACGEPVDPDEMHMQHQRLGVRIHPGCDLTNVCGEDVTGHTLMFVNYRPPATTTQES